MYSWTIVPVEGFDTRAFIENVRNDVPLTNETIEDLHAWVSKCNMRVCIREMAYIAMDIVKKDRSHENAISFLVEFVAGLEYARNKTVGRLKKLQSLFNCRTSHHAICFLKQYCESAQQKRQWKQKTFWFLLRVRCMDAYALSVILNATKDDICYYAGCSHTTNIEEYLLQQGLGTLVTDGEYKGALNKFRDLADKSDLTHRALLKLSGGPTLLLLGENHFQTSIDFGKHIVQLLEEHCATPMLFLIEKHISNGEDPLQCELACNQAKLAIHRSRCSEFVTHSHTKCTGLDVEAVDNRHADMGFLRAELLDLWDDDANFKAKACEFQKSCLLSMLNFCSVLKACSSVR